jgi:hypothetical protein
MMMLLLELLDVIASVLSEAALFAAESKNAKQSFGRLTKSVSESKIASSHPRNDE